MSLIAKISDLAIAIATDIKNLNTTITNYDGRVTGLEQTDAATELRLVELESNAGGGGSSLTMQEVRDEIYHWGVYRDVYAGSGWYKDPDGRVYSKGVASGETKKFPNDPNTYINILDSDLTDSKLRTLSSSNTNKVFATSNLSRLYYEDLNSSTIYSIAYRQNTNDVSSWDVGHISNFDNAFSRLSRFTGLDKISVAGMTSAVGMFTGAYVGNIQDISGWDTSNLVDAERMFGNDGPQQTNIDALKGIGALNVSSVTNAKNMFANARVSPLDLSTWDVSNVLDASGMFKDIIGRVSGLDGWRVGGITNMTDMFGKTYASDIGSDLSTWCVSNFETAPANFSTTMPAEKLPVWGTCPYAGYGWYKDPETGIVECNEVPDGETHQFEGDPKTYVCYYNASYIRDNNMENVATSNITDMNSLFMFKSGLAGKDISHWDVSNVTNMEYFMNRSDFDGDLSSWKVPLIASKPFNFLAGTPIENDLSKHPQWGVS